MALSVPALVYFLPPDRAWAVEPEQLQRFAYFLFIASFIVWIIASERRTAESLRRARDELQRQNEALTKEKQLVRESADRLQHLSHRLIEVQEEERRHLSRELHDEFGQLLLAIELQLHAAKAGAGGTAQADLEQSIALLRRAGEQVRDLALELRPPILEVAGLGGTLRWLAEQHQQRTGMITQVTIESTDVHGDVATACFRVTQQALTNIVQHAQARNVWIDVSQDGAYLQLAIRDDGTGFDVTKSLEKAISRGHLGLLGMMERAQILGGHLDIDSQPGLGTRIRAVFPLAANVARSVEHIA
jgi:signal transduction histidine kinase